MSDNFTFWWRARTARERALLLVMFGLMALLLGWLLVVRPLSDALDDAKTRHNAAVVALAEARARAQAGAVAGAAPSPLPADSLIGRTAAEAGFAGARIAAQGPGRATIAIDAARPQALFAWVLRLEASGLAVERLRAQANSDRTLSVEATLGKRLR